jgi:hypothetical protein
LWQAILLKRFASGTHAKLSVKTDCFYSAPFAASSIANTRIGVSSCQVLVKLGPQRCLEQTAELLLRPLHEVKRAAEAKGYEGVESWFVDEKKWKRLQKLTESKLESALTTDKEHAELLLDWKLRYAAAAVSNAPVETAVKVTKGLSGQARARESTNSRQVRQIVNQQSVAKVHFPSPTIALEDEEMVGGLSDEDKAMRTPDAKDNRNHQAHKPLDQATRSRINKQLGYNNKASPEERKLKKSAVERVLTSDEADELRAQLKAELGQVATRAEKKMKKQQNKELRGQKRTSVDGKDGKRKPPATSGRGEARATN